MSNYKILVYFNFSQCQIKLHKERGEKRNEFKWKGINKCKTN